MCMAHECLMSISQAEFWRVFARLVGERGLAGDALAGTFPLGTGWVHVRVEPQPPRRLGALCLPCQRVRLGFEGVEAAETAAWLARFARGFQRGGG